MFHTIDYRDLLDPVYIPPYQLFVNDWLQLLPPSFGELYKYFEWHFLELFSVARPQSALIVLLQHWISHGECNADSRVRKNCFLMDQ